MRDEEWLFVSDVQQKKSIARSASKKRTHCGKGGKMKLPSDYMTKKEIESMSGECVSYKLNSPMTWVEFNKMPDDIKKDYIRLISGKFNAPDSAIGKMLGISNCYTSQVFSRLGMASKKGVKPKWDKEGFLAWCAGHPVDVKLPDEEVPEEVPEEVHEEVPKEVAEAKAFEVLKTMAIPCTGSMVFEGNIEDIMKSIVVLLGGARVHINVTWDVLEEDHG